MAHAAPKYAAPALLDVGQAPRAVAAVLRRWAAAKAYAEAMLAVYEDFRDTLEGGTAFNSYRDARSWESTCWAAVEAAVPFDAGVAYKVRNYIVYVSPVSGRGLTHRWRRAES